MPDDDEFLSPQEWDLREIKRIGLAWRTRAEAAERLLAELEAEIGRQAREITALRATIERAPGQIEPPGCPIPGACACPGVAADLDALTPRSEGGTP
jgi:hypothetical protein